MADVPGLEAEFGLRGKVAIVSGDVYKRQLVGLGAITEDQGYTPLTREEIERLVGE